MSQLGPETRRLQGLNLAAFILKSLTTGKSKNEIIVSFDGDKQLFDLWFSFLVHNHWAERKIKKDLSYQWVQTEKGKVWVERLERTLNEPLL